MSPPVWLAYFQVNLMPGWRLFLAKQSLVFVNWTATSHLSSCRLFLNQPWALCHISASKRVQGQGLLCSRSLPWRDPSWCCCSAGDVMVGAGGDAGPAPDVLCHQPPGKTIYVYCNYCLCYNQAGSWVVKAASWYAQDCGFSHLSTFLLFTSIEPWNCTYHVYT